MVLKIKFSRYWDKLRKIEDDWVILVGVEVNYLNKLDKSFVEQDSRFSSRNGFVDYYKFNFNKCIVLLFEDFDGYRFSTIRKYGLGKLDYYKKNEGNVFEVEILDKSF